MTLRIVVDMQAAQTFSRMRGIGRYAISLVKAIAATQGDHRIILLLNDLIEGTIEPVRAELQGIIPQGDIHVWQGWGPTSFDDEAHSNARETSEVIREGVLLSLQPDVVLIPSPFEAGHTALSIGKIDDEVPVVSICHDLIPWRAPSSEHRNDPQLRAWYRHRLNLLLASSHVMTVSENSRQDVVDRLGIAPKNVTTILAGCDARFVKREVSPVRKSALMTLHDIDKPFILLAGSLEKSKNLKGFLDAMAALPLRLQMEYQIVVVGTRENSDDERLLALAENPTVRDALRITGHVSDEDLIDLYNACHAFVCPSLYEGFGLPPLEAMACGAPTIASNTTSLPEVLANPEAMFDPRSVSSMTAKIVQVLTDESFRRRLSERGQARAQELNWQACAGKALDVLSRVAGKPSIVQESSARILRPEPLRQKPLRILVQKLDHAGDFLLAFPAIAKIRARYPNARIDGLIGDWNRSAAEFGKVFDDIYTLDFFKAKSSVSPKLEIKDVDTVRECMPLYDYAIDLRRMRETREILLQMPALQYFGYNTGDDRMDACLTNPLPIHPEESGEPGFFDRMHIAEQMLRLVDTLPYANTDYIEPPKRAPAPRSSGRVAIFPRVGTDSRQWDSSRFVELVAKLAVDPAVTAIDILGVTQSELDEVGFHPDPKISYRVGLKFESLVKLLSQCDVCVGNNSFGVHLGSWAGCPVVAIYSGHELPDQWAPPFGNVEVISAGVACSPCHQPTKESCNNGLICLTSIDVEIVLVAIKSHLSKTARSKSRVLHRRSRRECRDLAIRALSRLKFTGKLTEASEDHHARTIVSAALSRNFPEVSLHRQRLFLDVSSFIQSLDDEKVRSTSDWWRLEDFIRRLQAALPRFISVEPIAARAHDHEFYGGHFRGISDPRHFFDGDRKLRTVIPVAGDIYLGFDSYVNRNFAQWSLLSNWRQIGMRTVFGVNAVDLVEDGVAPQEAADIALRNRINYLRFLLEFDGLIVSTQHNKRVLDAFVDRYGSLRDRSLQTLVNDALPTVGEGRLSAMRRSATDAQTTGLDDLVRFLTEENWHPCAVRASSAPRV